MDADTLLTNARLLTMSGRRGRALAVLGDRIVAVGEEQDILSLRGPRTRVYDLGGRLVLPGFTDSHLHPTSLASRFLQVELTGARTLQEALRRVGARAKVTPNGEWITGAGFDRNPWGDDWPSRHDLDRVAPNHPVALRTRDGHSAWVNSLALKLCGITGRTKALPGGVIRRDGKGQPTGILHETAIHLVWACPAFRHPQVGAGELKRALRCLLRQGITSVHVMEETDTLTMAQELRRRGELKLRLTLYRNLDLLDHLIAAGIRSGLGDEWLRIGGVKLLVDGALGSQTAWMFQPYGLPPEARRRRAKGGRADLRSAGRAGFQPAHSHGVPVLQGKELRDLVHRAHQAGLACAVHAIGDRANAEVLDVIGEVDEMARWQRALPDRIEHAQLLRPRDIPRFARLGVVASMQACHILGDIPVAERYWGRRSRWAYPIASLLRSGAVLAFGSDAPVETSDPLAGVYAAVERKMLDGEPRGGWYRSQEGIGLMAALRAYTLGPALATGEANTKGKLLPGFLADIVVLSNDITRGRGRRLLDTRVDMVFTGGKLRYQRRL